jgi:hypothetical protein
VNFRHILDRWTEAKMSPAACRSILEDLIARGHTDANFFNLDEMTRGGVAGSDELLFDFYSRRRDWFWEVTPPKRPSAVFALDSEALPVIGRLIGRVARAKNPKSVVEELGDTFDDDIAAFVLSAFSEETPHGAWPPVTAPGVYRREHACLVIRSRGAMIVTDPQALSPSWTTGGGRCPADLDGLPAAVCISHGHNDHWDLSSIMKWSTPGSLVIVPKVPAPSVLSERDYASLLNSLGFEAAAPEWFSTVRVGDIVVDILPFYGEQPTRALTALRPSLRNWGNCYRFNLPGWSLAILVDSGVDACGSVVDVLRRSVTERGPVDVLMSCCHAFPEAINQGLPHYAFTVPFQDLQEFARARGSMTLGPKGIAEACEAAQARFFLPYAHGFNGLGLDPVSTEGTHSETTILDRVRAELAERKVATEVVAWAPGDAMHFIGGRPEIRR